MVSGTATTISKVATAVCFVGMLESVTCTVKLYVPAVVGVPEMRPELPARFNPGGRVPLLTDHVYGDVPPVRANVAE